MKKNRFWAVMILGLLVVTSIVTSNATAGDEIMTGYVLKLEKGFVTVEDSETGQEVKVKYDKKTRVTGKLEEDIFVEVEKKNGYAVALKVVEGGDMLSGKEKTEDEKDETKSGEDKRVETEE